jgi:hypothetical protein
MNYNNRELTAQSSVQNGTQRASQGFSQITMVTKTTGTITGGVCKLQGSTNGTDWYDLATRTLAAAGVFSDSVSGAHVYVRVAITTAIAGGGTVDLWLSMGTLGGGNNDTGFGPM